jgi:hypothetical protein
LSGRLGPRGDLTEGKRLLIAQAAGSAAFPRRNWVVSSDGSEIGEVALTGWGVGTILLRGDSYSAGSTQEITGSLPREYHVCQNERIIHLARERSDFLYSIDDEVFSLRSRRIFPWRYFGRSWPSLHLYRQSERIPIGSISQKRAFRDDIEADFPNEIDEVLQLFILWIVVDRAQWSSYFKPM